MKIFINSKIKKLLTSKKRFLVLWGGRGSGKSYDVSDILIIKSLTENSIIILCVKQTQTSIKDSVYGLLKQRIYDHNLESYFEFTDAEIRNKITGSKFIFKGLQAPENTLKSLSNIKYCWIEEGQTALEETWRILTPSIRAEGSQIFVTFNPRYEDDIVYKEFVLKENKLAEVIYLTYKDNKYFPEVLQQEMERDKEEDYINYEYVWEGKIKKIDPKALWKKGYIRHLSQEELTNFNTSLLSRIVVAVDPSITSNESSDACGLVVAGKYADSDEYIILSDETIVASPATWAKRAIDLYTMWKADRIVAETNQGGDMVETIIKNIDRTIAYKGVHASRGKIIRAEPVAALYENKKVKHLKIFTELEKELYTYTGEKGQKSPNRLDACVWALTELSGIKSIITPRNAVKSNYFSGSRTSLSNIKM